jgi:hypothetical protein
LRKELGCKLVKFVEHHLHEKDEVLCLDLGRNTEFNIDYQWAMKSTRKLTNLAIAGRKNRQTDGQLASKDHVRYNC